MRVLAALALLALPLAVPPASACSYVAMPDHAVLAWLDDDTLLTIDGFPGAPVTARYEVESASLVPLGAAVPYPGRYAYSADGAYLFASAPRGTGADCSWQGGATEARRVSGDETRRLLPAPAEDVVATPAAIALAVNGSRVVLYSTTTFAFLASAEAGPEPGRILLAPVGADRVAALWQPKASGDLGPSRARLTVLEAASGKIVQAGDLPLGSARNGTALTAAPDGRTIAVVLSDARNSGEVLLVRASDLAVTTRRTDPGTPITAAWGGSGLAVASHDYRNANGTETFAIIRLYPHAADLDGALETRRPRPPWPEAFAWSPDGAHLALGEDGRLVLLGLRDGEWRVANPGLTGGPTPTPPEGPRVVNIPGAGAALLLAAAALVALTRR